MRKENLATVMLTLDGKRDYPILIGSGIRMLLPQLLTNLEVGKQVAIITNSILRKSYAKPIEAALTEAGYKVKILELPPGEKYKNLTTVSQILDSLLSLKLERKDTVIALGGGIVGDLSGFVASIYLRGIHFIQVPTTLLAQVDASIGGKTGVNHERGKNLIGSFYQPKIVLCDTQTLESLPKKEILCGLAEVVKYGMIRNIDLLAYLEKNARKLAQLNISSCPEIWTHLVTESVKDKAHVVSKDEQESGLRETLNFGHTIGHAIESATAYNNAYLHGEAVAIGMHAVSLIAVEMGLLSEEDQQRLSTLLTTLGFSLTLRHVTLSTLLEKLTMDKKVRNKKLRFIMPTAIGAVITRDDVPMALIETVIKNLIEEDI
ncbi:MAG: 3-dehydroquinate synthase [Candidatus Margulisbacteria bacterium]|nr:3-dehydroquinate synthase [Candidatus Margulisiibacteriota bacterium]